MISFYCCKSFGRLKACMSSNNRIVSVVDDDIYIIKLFHEALSENIDGISVFFH